MGVWGLASDENDLTWDAAGFGIQQRFMGLHPLSICHDRFVEYAYQTHGDHLPVGLAILSLKLGCKLKMSSLRWALEDLNVELMSNNQGGWEAWDLRKEMIRKEIEMVTSAANNEGYAPDSFLTGACGISSAPYRQMGAEPCSDVRRNENGVLEQAVEESSTEDSSNKTDFRTMKVSTLRDECKKLNLVSTGIKDDLVARLESAHDRPLVAESDFRRLKVPELREECKKRNISGSGTKAELIERLETAASSDE